jgi:hypothetical protein
VTAALLRLLSCLALCLPLAGCAADPVTLSVELKGKRYSVEIADDAEEQTRGLMFRRELAPDHGMLFVFDAEYPQAFWMRNCYIALDILYFDGQGRFVNGHYSVPPCNAAQCPNYESRRPARYVLELGAGVGRALDLRQGDVLTLPVLPPG